YSAISSVSFVSYLSSLPLFPNSYKHLVLTYEGKNLIKVRHPSGEEFTYSYNHEGLRIKRSGNRSGTVTYSYSGNKLILQESSSLKLEFLYDEKDYLYGFIKNNNERYYYIRDALGNILGIINQNGQIVVQYSYTAYGVCSISGNTSLGNENPFRYKGYYYDVETSLYYLTTRYYDPEIGRFISPDSVDYLDPQSINGLNLYAYANNNPINNFYINNRLNYNSSFRIYTKLLNRLSAYLMFSDFDYAKNHRNPNRGEPNSIGRIFYPDGSPKQEREYGPDGRPIVDHDHHPGENVGYNHDHDWDWDKDPPRQPAREPSKVLAALGIIETGVALIWLVGNDATGYGAADDGLIPAVATSFLAFWAILFNEGEDNTW
ncbi:MAG: RHS repeat-associated core domain-containing protein, partial [Bacillales bacterium]|nr:RHS repeat-associated core domain-containing protein [Bacillales bacterium]